MNKGLEHFPKKNYKRPQIHEKMLNITKHQGNANQNRNEISSHLPITMALVKKTRHGEKGTLGALLVGM